MLFWTGMKMHEKRRYEATDMRRITEALNQIVHSIEYKNVLEIACGSGEFSFEAAQYARSVTCIDLDDSRLLPSVRNAENIVFLLMDAINLQMASDSVDVIVFYNALAHVENELEKILNECYRVLRKRGELYFISSFGIDKIAVEATLLPMLKKQKIYFSLSQTKNYIIVQISA